MVLPLTGRALRTTTADASQVPPPRCPPTPRAGGRPNLHAWHIAARRWPPRLSYRPLGAAAAVPDFLRRRWLLLPLISREGACRALCNCKSSHTGKAPPDMAASLCIYDMPAMLASTLRYDGGAFHLLSDYHAAQGLVCDFCHILLETLEVLDPCGMSARVRRRLDAEAPARSGGKPPGGRRGCRPCLLYTSPSPRD